MYSYQYTNRPQPRIFVSSVMADYQEYREAASAGIRQAGCDAVLAEDFAAQGTSSRNACLDGVQSADALVLLLGPRYGWIAPSGRSATEEEYQEARHRHMPILVFVQDGLSREPDQQDFIARVEDYIHGHFRRSFQSSDDLTRFVKEAVMARDLTAVPQNLGDAEGPDREALNRRPPDNQYSVWMKTAWTTLRDEEVVDPLTLTDNNFKDQVLRLGHDCEPPLFRYERPKQQEASALRLSIIQGASRGAMAEEDATVVAIHADGTLTVLQDVTGDRSGHDPKLSFVTMHRLDPMLSVTVWTGLGLSPRLGGMSTTDSCGTIRFSTTSVSTISVAERSRIPENTHGAAASPFRPSVTLPTDRLGTIPTGFPLGSHQSRRADHPDH